MPDNPTPNPSELLTKIDAIGTLVEERLGDRDEQVTLVRETVDSIAEKMAAHEEWQSKIQQALDKARFGMGAGPYGAMDSLREAIPERFQPNIDTYVRIGKARVLTGHTPRNILELRNDPVFAAAVDAWLKNAAKCQLGGYATEHSRCLEEMAKLEQAMGSTKAALAESTTTTGGFTVPSPLEAYVARIIEDSAVCRPLCRKMTMTSWKHLIPTGNAGVVVAKVDENAGVGQSEPTFTQGTLEALMIGARGLASLQILQDSAIGITDYWLERASEAYALYEDGQILEGDGTDYTGYSDAVGVNEVTSTTNGAAITYKKLVDALYAGGKRSTRRATAAWFMHTNALRALVGLESSGVPVLNRQDIARVLSENIAGPGFGEGTILGYPVWTSDTMSVGRTQGSSTDATNVYFGPPFDSTLIGDLTGLDFAVSEHAAFHNAQLSLRLLKRTGILVTVPAAMTKYTGILAG